MKKVTAFLLSFFFVFQSCHKVVYLSETLKSHPWQIQQSFENGTDRTRPCVLDDVYRFNDNDSFKLATGDAICFLGEQTTYSGYWDMAPNELKMNLLYSNHNYLFNIISLNDEKLEVTYTEDTINYRVIFGRAK